MDNNGGMDQVMSESQVITVQKVRCSKILELL